jgi:hypothetical protein
MQLKNTVLLYLSTMQENDAKGFGALEHPTATTVVLPELMPRGISKINDGRCFP